MIYILIYTSFVTDGNFPTGNDLNKNDWLSFFGSYLGVVGTVTLSLVAVRQNRRFKEENDKSQAELNGINKKLIDIQAADKMPFIDADFESIMRTIGELDVSFQKKIEQESIPLNFSPAMPRAILENKMQNIITCKDNILEMYIANPTVLTQFINPLMMPDADIKVRKLKLTNIGNNAAINVKIVGANKSDISTFNLGVSSSIEYLIYFQDTENEYDFHIEFNALDNNRYRQSFSYKYNTDGYSMKRTNYPILINEINR